MEKRRGACSQAPRSLVHNKATSARTHRISFRRTAVAKADMLLLVLHPSVVAAAAPVVSLLQSGVHVFLTGTMHARPRPEALLLNLKKVGEKAARELVRLLQERVERAPPPEEGELEAESRPLTALGEVHRAFVGDGVCARLQDAADASGAWTRVFMVGTEWAAYRTVHSRP